MGGKFSGCEKLSLSMSVVLRYFVGPSACGVIRIRFMPRVSRAASAEENYGSEDRGH